MKPMTKTKLKSTNEDFIKSFGLSLALHGFILSIFLTKFIFFTEPMIDFSQAISVNIGDFKENNRLPEKIKPEAQDLTEDIKISEKNKKIIPDKKDLPKKDEINLNKVKAKQKIALNKLTKSSALDKIRQDLKNDSIAKLKSTEQKPNMNPRVIAAGSALGGLDKLQADNYLQEVDQSVKQFWSLPQWLINKPLKAQALVKFNIQGQILSVKIISSSGNNSYDQYCLKAIENAAPFPKVPDKLSEKFQVDGVVIGFPE